MKLTIYDFPHSRLVTENYDKGADVEPLATTSPTFILASDIEAHMPPSLLAEFHKFMSGQTVAAIGNMSGYYLSDVDDFLKGKGVTD